MTDKIITLAAIRHYQRALSITVETEERIEEEDMDRRIDAAIKNNTRIDHAAFLTDEQREALVAEALAKDPEYLAVRAELARVLALGPDDLNPLEWESKDDPRMHAWLRAVDLSRRLSTAMVDSLTVGWPEPTLRPVEAAGREPEN
jgi:hypothetical protein